MKESSWVHTCYQMNKVTGYVIETNRDWVKIQVTIPWKDCILVVPRDEVIEGDDVLGPDELQELIELTLQLRDKEWFTETMSELSKWHKVESVHGFLFP